MVKEIIHDTILLARKSEAATAIQAEPARVVEGTWGATFRNDGGLIAP